MHVIAVQWYSVTNGENGIVGVEFPSFFDKSSNTYFFTIVVAIAGIVTLRGDRRVAVRHDVASDP